MYTPSILTVVGTHAGESLSKIIKRKQEEIKKIGYTYWLYKSHSAKPSDVQLLKDSNKTICFMIGASSPSGTKPTIHNNKAHLFSIDQQHWDKIPNEITVTGTSKGAFALVFKNIQYLENETLDLWRYSNYHKQDVPVKIRLGDSTVIVINKPSLNSPNKMKSHIRKIFAMGELKKPYCVFVK
jgi:hypothetical protein